MRTANKLYKISFYYSTISPIEVHSREVHAVFSYFFLLMSLLPLLLLSVPRAYE